MGNRVVYLPAYEAEVEYLKSTGTQWIDTGIIATENTRIVAKLYTEQDENKNWFGGQVISGSGGYVLNHFPNAKLEYMFGDSGWRTTISAPILGEVFTVDYSKGGLKVNNSTISSVSYSTFPTQTKSICIYTRQIEATNSKISGRVYYLKIYDSSTLVRDFIPVRIGTTGYMYDKVSRQLFANAGAGSFVLGNDVANATVPQLRHVVYFGGQRCVGFEKVYEKCAWLKGRNGAYIDTEHPLTTLEDAFAIHARYDKTLRNEYNQEQELFGYASGRDGNVTNLFVRAYIFGSNGFNANYYIHKAGAMDWGGADLGVNMDGEATIELKADENNYYVNYDGVNVVKTPLLPLTKETYGNVYLFNLNDNMGRGHFNGDIAYFRITDPTFTIDRVNMFPCRLLVDIPAILDGNGIARQAGTCGMWDTVSNRFFGNVANRGTFDVVYMEEGVDYEVHEWLKVSVNKKADMMVLPIDSTELYLKHKHISGVNYHYFQSIGEDTYYDYFYENDSRRCSIWDTSTRVIVYYTQDITEDDIVIECNSNKRYVNGYEVPIYGSTIKQVSIISRNQNGFEGLFSAISVDGVVRYVPVKLLRPLPSKYDANGIARNAGECGMYDTVNDLFYGNVASSGAFTVSDD